MLTGEGGAAAAVAAAAADAAAAAAAAVKEREKKFCDEKYTQNNIQDFQYTYEVTIYRNPGRM